MRVAVQARAAGLAAAVRVAPRHSLGVPADWAAAARRVQVAPTRPRGIWVAAHRERVAPARRRAIVMAVEMPTAAVAAARLAAMDPAVPRVPTVRAVRRAEARWAAAVAPPVRCRVAARVRAAAEDAAAAAVDEAE